MKEIYGRKPVLEAVKGNIALQSILIAHGQQGQVIEQIKTEAKKRKIPVKEISASKYSRLSENKNAQGVIAVKSFQKYYTPGEILSLPAKGKFPLYLILDSVQDAHNLGAILRTAESAGVDGVFITVHQSADITPVVEKISAGAVSHLRICQVKSLHNLMKMLKQEGVWIAGSHLENAKDYTEADYNMPVALVLGNEEKGIRRLTAENCDFLIKIPMMGKIQSLNVSVASGILLYEIIRQRSEKSV